MVFNDHYGKHEELPFDLRHKGGAIVFNLAPDAERAAIEGQRKALKGQLTRALKPFVARPASGALHRLGEVRFDYPGSPWDRWEFRSDNPQDVSPPRVSSSTGHAGGMVMTAPASHHLDLKPDPHQRVCNRLKFRLKLTRDCPGSYVYLMVQVTSKDRKTAVKPAWIACDVGNKPPAKHGPSEWIIYGKPSANGWTEFDLRLPDVIGESCFGQEDGLEFGELLSVRLRGSVSVSPIELYRQPAP